MKLPQKTLLAVLSAAAITIASPVMAANYKGEGFAAPAPCPTVNALKDGFYVGLQGGYDSYNVRQSGSSTRTNADGVVNATSSSQTHNPNGWVGGALVGYGQYFETFYLGAEAMINASSAETSGNSALSSSDADSTATITANTNFKVNSSYGLALLPGVKLNDSTLGYIRLGYNWANMKAKVNFVDSTAPESTIAASKSNTQGGWVYGLGMESAFYQNFSARAEYSYTDYNSFNAGGSSFSPSDNQFMLALIYHIV